MYVVVMTLGAVLLHRVLAIVPSVIFGTYLAWGYLRFLQPHSGAVGRYAKLSLHLLETNMYTPACLMPQSGHASGLSLRLLCCEALAITWSTWKH